MRLLSVSENDYSGCCAVAVLCDFPEKYYENGEDKGLPLKEPLTDEEWFHILHTPVLAPLITFANASVDKEIYSGNRGSCTPAKLAKWLRKQGEKVYTGANAVNPTSGNTITIYTWAPSPEFRTKIKNYINKKNKKANADWLDRTRGASGL